MQHEDYLMKQIEMFGRALGKLLEKLLGMNSKNEIIETANQTFMQEISLNINDLSCINIDVLKQNEKINNENLEKIADVLVVVAENSNENLKAKCVEIYKYINVSDKTFSLERQAKIDRLKN